MMKAFIDRCPGSGKNARQTTLQCDVQGCTPTVQGAPTNCTSTPPSPAMEENTTYVSKRASTLQIMKFPPKTTYVRSDGTPTQFNNATQFFWIGMHADRGRGRLDWSLHCSCHGKDACDSELGYCKNMLRLVI